MNTDIKIRYAEPSERDTLIQLNQALFKYDQQFDDTSNMEWTQTEEAREYFAARIADDDKLALIAEHNGEILGYLVGAIEEPAFFRRTGKIGSLENMLVLERHRGRGIGKQLVERFFAWAREHGCARVSVVASAANERSIKFYRECGFSDLALTLETAL